MSLIKQKKPRWADGNPNYAIEMSEAKKTLGWLAQEKPPFQWMNWLFLKIKQWLDWGEERSEFSDSVSFHTTGASVTWSGTQMVVPAGGLYFEWRVRGTIKNNILPAGTYDLADGEYLLFIPHDTSATSLSLGVYATLTPGQYAIVAGASLVDNTNYTEIILFRRRGGILEVPLFKTAVQAGGALASNDLLVHNHSDADDGGQLDWDQVWSDAVHDHSSDAEGGKLDWDTCWADAVHSHQSNAEGGTLDHGAALIGLGDDDHTQYVHLDKPDGSRQTMQHYLAGPTPSTSSDYATKNYVDNMAYSIANTSGYRNASSPGSISYSSGDLDPMDYERSFNVTNIDSAGNFRITKTISGASYSWTLLWYLLTATSWVVMYDSPTGTYNRYQVDSVTDMGSYFQCHASGDPDINAVFGSSALCSLPYWVSYRNTTSNVCYWMIGCNALNYPSYDEMSFYLYMDYVASDDIVFGSISGIGYQERGDQSWDFDNGIWLSPPHSVTYDGGTRWRWQIEIAQASAETLCYYLMTAVIPKDIS